MITSRLFLKQAMNILEKNDLVIIMKKSYMLDGLDCANCAAKMEKAINNLEEVKTATVNFMTAKLTIEADGDYDDLISKVEKVIRKIEPDVKIRKA